MASSRYRPYVCRLQYETISLNPVRPFSKKHKKSPYRTAHLLQKPERTAAQSSSRKTLGDWVGSARPRCCCAIDSGGPCWRALWSKGIDWGVSRKALQEDRLHNGLLVLYRLACVAQGCWTDCLVYMVWRSSLLQFTPSGMLFRASCHMQGFVVFWRFGLKIDIGACLNN